MEIPEQWPRIKEIVGAALEREAGERSAFLDEACAQNAELVSAVALKIEDCVDHVFQDAGSGDASVLGNMADQEQRRARVFGVAHEIVRGGAHLRDGSWRGVERLR